MVLFQGTLVQIGLRVSLSIFINPKSASITHNFIFSLIKCRYRLVDNFFPSLLLRLSLFNTLIIETPKVVTSAAPFRAIVCAFAKRFRNFSIYIINTKWTPYVINLYEFCQAHVAKSNQFIVVVVVADFVRTLYLLNLAFTLFRALGSADRVYRKAFGWVLECVRCALHQNNKCSRKKFIGERWKLVGTLCKPSCLSCDSRAETILCALHQLCCCASSLQPSTFFFYRKQGSLALDLA